MLTRFVESLGPLHDRVCLVESAGPGMGSEIQNWIEKPGGQFNRKKIAPKIAPKTAPKTALKVSSQ